mmetsp:Transcript_7738/g.1006  ORF Transcript_7738/g.1006 Transcript_7738/m.1006 type:complete len:85 (+) Transcript_7738:380-634(+)|eukprot:CAMPEP_0168315190 /NCGR_PEP_ID=MMETSP0210-20121227/10419_1 /TAXON_ID=40633 /ORGANISM="Condylostoma magnum, Strain COL2" /LENGTH=84 /DNA_ID=CAMNT_0008286951 /DNA_START=353 /DNA_END=607 /DNA_ORIENTATION=+
MTNLAIAMTFAPDLQFGQIIALSGTYACDGNQTPVAEFNAYTDPESVAIVLERCSNLTIIPWETTCKINDEIAMDKEFYEIYNG